MHAGDVDLRILDDTTILDIDTTDLGECAGGGVVVSEELSDNSEFAAGIDGHALAEEVLDTHTEGVKITTVGVTNTIEPALDGAVFAGAASLTAHGARVGSVGSRNRVCLPNVHFTTAGTEVACSSIRVIR